MRVLLYLTVAEQDLRQRNRIKIVPVFTPLTRLRSGVMHDHIASVLSRKTEFLAYLVIGLDAVDLRFRRPLQERSTCPRFHFRSACLPSSVPYRSI